MTEPAIVMSDLVKRFGGNHVLKGTSLSVSSGQTFAFLGRNGTGKTTTIRMLLGLLKPESRSIRVLGLDPASNAMEVRRRVGYLAEDQTMFGWMTIDEIIRFVALNLDEIFEAYVVGRVDGTRAASLPHNVVEAEN